MNRFIKHIKKQFFGLLTLVFILAIFNYITDFYGVFSVRKTFVDFTPNEHSLKLNHFINNSNRTKLIFGNSRSGSINNHDKFKDWYNMSYSMGVPEEFLFDITKIIEAKKNISEILIFLDEVSLFELFENHQRQVLRKVIDFESLEKFQYLFILPNFSILSAMLSSVTKDIKLEKTLVYDIYNSGSIIEKNFNYNFSGIECQVENYLSYEWNKPLINLFNKKLTVLNDIKEVCERNNIKIKFISQPFSSRYTLEGFRVKSYFQFLDYLKSIDFDVLPPVNCIIIQHKEGQWRDLHHYNYSVAKEIEKNHLN